MNVYSNASLVGLKIKLTDNYHYKNSCGCKICSTHHWDEFIPADRTLYREIQVHKIKKCCKKSCKKFGCECGW